MKEFKPGYKHRIKTELNTCYYYGDYYFYQEMKKYKGKIAVIESCEEGLHGTKHYIIDIDDGRWLWSPVMLEKFEAKNRFKSLPKDFTGTVKIENGFIAEIVKEKKEILDKAEKEYLSAVIKPFKEKVTGIAIRKFRDSKCYLYIDIIGGDGFGLPNFKQGTMYKNMKIDRKYTLKELGLD